MEVSEQKFAGSYASRQRAIGVLRGKIKELEERLKGLKIIEDKLLKDESPLTNEEDSALWYLFCTLK